MLIDIHSKMQPAHPLGFQQWANTFNLKKMAKTLSCLQEKRLLDYAELEKACNAAAEKYHAFSERTKANSARMKKISELQINAQSIFCEQIIEI